MFFFPKSLLFNQGLKCVSYFMKRKMYFSKINSYYSKSLIYLFLYLHLYILIWYIYFTLYDKKYISANPISGKATDMKICKGEKLELSLKICCSSLKCELTLELHFILYTVLFILSKVVLLLYIKTSLYLFG